MPPAEMCAQPEQASHTEMSCKCRSSGPSLACLERSDIGSSESRRSLEEEWNHFPFASHLFGTKLLRIPLLGSVGGCAEVCYDEPESAEKRTIDHLALRCGCNGKTKIKEALAGVMRTDEISKETLLRKRILLQAGQVFMAPILHCPAVQVHGDSDEGLGR